MLNILINAYAVAPNWGSEQGMGWNWVINIAKYCKCYVITEGEWQKEIEEAVKQLPQKDNIIFYYNPVSEKVRKMCWNQGDWRFYYYYRLWQKKTLKIAKDICKEHKIDVIHQLNMVGFREPGLLWKIDGIPYVWGPVGGMENIPTSYLKNATLKQSIFCRIKNTINTIQYKFQPNVRRAIKHSNVLISAVKGVEKVFKDVYNRDSILINETGCNITPCIYDRKTAKEGDSTFNIIWVGKFDFRKQLEIALYTIAKLKSLNIKLHICGSGSESQIKKYKDICNKLNINDKCIWYGKTENKAVLELMQRMDIFLFTSINDLTSTVVLEAIQNSLPIVCHDICGFGNIVDNRIGRKITLKTPDDSINDFATVIKELYSNRQILVDMQENFKSVAKELTYESKAKKMCYIYDEIVKQI
ncbi:MAG: glycosyltransferase [Bacteroidales bacterium]|nr:glycosyltransferase [Bacteroidales bacterium]